MNTKQTAYTVGIVSILLISAHGVAAMVSPYQSPARPLGLDIVDLVMASGSDARGQDLNNNVLADMLQYIPDGHINIGTDTLGIDPGALYLSERSSVRVYFVGEHTAYHNALGFTAMTYQDVDLTIANDEVGPEGWLIFPDSPSKGTYGDVPTALSVIPDENHPLKSGDFVDLGTFEEGTQLDFFLIANGGANPAGEGVFFTQPGANPDGLEHVAVFDIGESPYILIGYEDLLNGGDLDYDDFFFAVEIRSEPFVVPEPSVAALGILMFPALGWLVRVRKRG